MRRLPTKEAVRQARDLFLFLMGDRDADWNLLTPFEQIEFLKVVYYGEIVEGIHDLNLEVVEVQKAVSSGAVDITDAMNPEEAPPYVG